MKFLFIDSFKIVRKIEMNFRPMVGDKVDYGYFPFATVKNILLQPKADTLREIAADVPFSTIADVEAIIYLD